MGDRRDHARADVSATAVVLARHNAGTTMTIESVSISGARLVGALTVAVGERVQILFEIDGRPIEIRGEVVRAELRHLETDIVAVRFVDLDHLTRERVREMVRRALEREGDVMEEEGE